MEILRDGALSLASCSKKQQAIKRSTVRKLNKVVDSDVSAQDQLRVGYCHETLKQSTDALAYLEKRGLKSVIESIEIGRINPSKWYPAPSPPGDHSIFQLCGVASILTSYTKYRIIVS